jgi:hypothetical protein
MNGHEEPDHRKLNNRASVHNSAPAGLLTLLHPYLTPEAPVSGDLQPLMEIAVEMRKRNTDHAPNFFPAHSAMPNPVFNSPCKASEITKLKSLI